MICPPFLISSRSSSALLLTGGWSGSLLCLDGVHRSWCLRTAIAFCGLTMRQLTVAVWPKHISKPQFCPKSSSFCIVLRIDQSFVSSFRPLPRIVPRTRTQEQRRCIVYPRGTGNDRSQGHPIIPGYFLKTLRILCTRKNGIPGREIYRCQLD
jgi:hypothetical protein